MKNVYRDGKRSPALTLKTYLRDGERFFGQERLTKMLLTPRRWSLFSACCSGSALSLRGW